MHAASSAAYSQLPKRRVSNSSIPSAQVASPSAAYAVKNTRSPVSVPSDKGGYFSTVTRVTPQAQPDRRPASNVAASVMHPSVKTATAYDNQHTSAPVQNANSAMTQMQRSADFLATQHNTFAVNMPPLNRHWLDINSLPAPLRNATHYLAVTNFPRNFIRGRNADHELVPNNPKKRYTLVLDLDETLMHCSPNPPQNGRPDCIVHFDPNRRGAVGYVQFRPFAKLLLEVASRDFDIVIFTASTKMYADQVIDALDPKGEFIDLRLYRQHCTEVAGGFTKDLRTLERPLDRVVLIDNSPVSIAMQPDHSVICSSFFGDAPEDKELVDLMLLLREMVETDKTVPELCVPKYGNRQWINDLRGGIPI